MTKKMDKAAGAEYIKLVKEEEEVKNTEAVMELDEMIIDDFEKRLNSEPEVDLDEFDLDDEDDEITLEQAVHDFRNGMQDAFDYLFSFYKPRLDRLARRMNDEDLSQELSIVLYRAALKFDATAGAKFNTFFWKCAQNHIGTQKIRRTAQKRGGNKKANSEQLKELREKEKENSLTLEEQKLLIKLEEEARPAKTVSLHATYDTKDSSVEVGAFIEDQSTKNTYKDNNLMTDLTMLEPLLKEKEVKAIKMVIKGYTLEEIGRELDNITAPAVHVMLRRLGKKKGIESRLREILG